MTIFALRGWARSGLVGRADRERLRLLLRLRLRLRLRLSRAPLVGPLLRERERDRERIREASRGVTERAMSSFAAGGVGERPREGLRLSDMMVVLLALKGLNSRPECSQTNSVSVVVVLSGVQWHVIFVA